MEEILKSYESAEQAKNLLPISYTRKLSDIHSGGFSQSEETTLGFEKGALTPKLNALHDLVTMHRKTFASNMLAYKEKHLKGNSDYAEKDYNVFIHTTAKVDASVIFDTTNGIVVVESGAHIMPFNYIVGPIRIDESATIKPHSHITNSYIGKFCKVGGEVSGSIIESYSNKAHNGGVYDSYIGSWVNIGGGSSTSNMKNTYGPIKMNGVDTGEQFLGCIIADYAKTAINTSIYTGKVIGVSALLYGTVTEDVPSFTNYIFNKEKLVLCPLEVAIKGAERMYARRNLPFSEDDRAVLSYAYTQSESERAAKGVTSGELTF